MRLAGHAALVRSAEFTHDGASILTASADGTARLWPQTRAILDALDGPWADIARLDPDALDDEGLDLAICRPHLP